MNSNILAFTTLENTLAESGKSFRDYLAPEFGKVYVVTITRDNCSACERHKPKLRRLVKKVSAEQGDKVVFIQVYVKQLSGNQEESMRSKDMFGHYFYPTDLLLLRTADRGVVEMYRNVSPTMKELEANISATLQVAEFIAKETG